MSTHDSWWRGETPLFLSDVPRVLPNRPNGRRIHRAAVYRWATSGLNGVRLRRFKIGGNWATTAEELSRFQVLQTELCRGDA